MRASVRLLVPCALVLGFATGAAQAQNFGPPELREVWVDGARAQVWKNGFGECWHSAFGPPPPANECNPIKAVQYVPPAPSVAIAPPPPLPARPAVISAPPTPAPAPAPYVAPVVAPKKDRG